MRSKRHSTILDENNNAIVVDNVSIRLDDTTIVCVGDIVWLKHNAMHFLTTPFIIEHFNSE